MPGFQPENTRAFAGDERFRKLPDLARALDELLSWSPVYKRWLDRFPPLTEAFLHELNPHRGPFGPGRLQQSWPVFAGRFPDSPCRLQHFRRLHTLRIAVREHLAAAPMPSLLREYSDLAEDCLGRLLDDLLPEHRRQYGEPWLEDADRPAGLLVLAFGKLGGRELNLFSDLDLVFVCEGHGHCRKNGHCTHTGNTAFYARVVRSFCQRSQERTAAGMLFHIDLRLRPEGESGPTVPSLGAVLQYYYARGQPWERMALLKARRVYGSREMEHEFTETLQPFRYPRYAPPNLSEEVAFLKTRTEKEILGAAALHEDIKSGQGGIREIEFVVQTLQLWHASRLPFLQTPETEGALRQLRRYGILPEDDAQALLGAWGFLRRIENLLQMQEEKPVHRLPATKTGREALAVLLGFSGETAFMRELKMRRDAVRRHYEALFPRRHENPLQEEWLALFSAKTIHGSLRRRLLSWFGNREKEGEKALRNLANAQPGRPVTREEISLFAHLTEAFGEVLPRTADPVQALRRVASFAQAYGARREFLHTCQENPHFFTLLALLFDRSSYLHQLLCRFPSIMEELLQRVGRRRKSVQDQEEDLRLGPDNDFAAWLWLFVKAEQVRIVGNQLLGFDSRAGMEEQLSDLAEAVCREGLRRHGLEEKVGLLAFGKFGGGELSPGSDLDLVFIATHPPEEGISGRIRSFLRLLGHDHPLGRTFSIDLRLRPHGKDGPLLPGFARFRQYYLTKARDWEVQALVRSRPIAGPASLRKAFGQFRHKLLFASPSSRPPGKAFEDPTMRSPRLREKVGRREPVLCFKNAPGGLVDLELFAQYVARRLGAAIPALRVPRVRTLIAAIAAEPSLSSCAPLQEAYARFREIELALRRETFTDTDQLPADPEQQGRLARWLGHDSWDDLHAEIAELLAANQERLASPLPTPSSFNHSSVSDDNPEQASAT